MSEISQRYAGLAARFTDIVKAVPDNRWSSPSPCEGWTARDIVGHMVSTHGMFLGFIGLELGDIPSAENDPLAAWSAARDKVQAALDDPSKAEATFDGHFGTSALQDAIDRFICFDLIVHRWDLARATGGDQHLDPGEIRRLREDAAGFGDAMRSPGAFGPALEAPPGADEQTELLAFLGRQSSD